MNHRNTLNTRLLPLSILISSLVSGGAMATSTTLTKESKSLQPKVEDISTGKVQRWANGGSIQGTVPVVEKEPVVEKSIYEKLSDYLAAGIITQAEKDRLELLGEKKEAEKNAQTAVELAEKAAETSTQAFDELKKKEATAVQEVAAKKQTKTDLEADFATKDGEKKAAITAITGITLDPSAADIAQQVTQLITTSETELQVKTQALVERTEKAEKAAEDKRAHADKISEFGQQIKELEGKLADLITEKGDLDTALSTAESAQHDAEADSTTDIAKAKKEHDQTEGNLSSQDDALKATATANKEAYDALVKTYNDNIKLANDAVTENGAKSKKLEDEKSGITNEKNTAEGQTQDIEQAANTAEQAKIDAKKQLDDVEKKINKAKQAEEAIKAAEAAKTAAESAEDEHQKSTKELDEIKTNVAKATTAKSDADAALLAKQGELNDAKDAVTTLVNNASAIKLSAVDKTIVSGTIDTVATDTIAIDTKVDGGTQEVAAKGKVIGSIVTENGSINLAADAQAIDSVITEGTMTNSGGTDTNTQVGAKGQLTLKGANDTQIAKSEGATVAKGGVVTADTHSWINNMVSEGEVTAKADAKVSNSTIKGGTLTLQDKALATGTTLEGGIFTLESGSEAQGTTINGGLFDVKSGASIADTTLNEVDFTLVSGVTANNTTVNDGTFTLAGTANDTIVNGGVFDVQQGATANTVNVNGGKFNLMERAQAAKLIVENGYALIAGELKDATFHGGTAIFDKTATISGNINAVENSVITVHDGAKTQDANLNLAGNMQLVGANAPQNALHRAAVSNPAQFAFKNVALDGGTVDMSSTNAQLTMASLSGAGTFNLTASLYNQANAPLNVTGDANGSFGIQLSDNGVAPTNLQLIDVQGNNAARFSLSNGPINLGNYKHNLVSDGKGGYKLVADTAALTPSTAGVLAVANTMPVIFNAELSSIQNRLDKQSTSANESGVWINYLNNNFKVKGTAANFDQKLNGVTLGGDKAIEVGDSVLSIGGFAARSSSDIKSDYQSSGSVESNSLGAYAQYLTNGGYYLNGVLKTNQFKQKLNITSNGSSANGSANFSGLGVALKAGKHINVDAMYVSPYAALSTFTSGKSQYQLSNGMDAQNQGSRNTTGTLGVNTGYRFVLNSGAEIKPYALFSVDHDLMARNNVLVNGEMFDNSRKGTRVNAGVGMNVNMTKNLSIGSEVKLSKGKNVDTPVTINLGVGYTF
ncbi:autotransporter outer membrane beta-barrel domain-containing protein [Yersinia bercovieri]|uniref:Autotransporter outer membrane beta-barrel domain-containing protein n=2 Tax=Yersinia bercovieri TaxID=634 RepID=A0A2G4U4H8_YERBE|nr:autotransporter outer membrane beta-barrel domain-containing protein [Yersinia bercovieri]EEQ05787.1 Type V secretory pathway, adhesin AidA [Yersinia bercovieri ATCC 43970]PHZ28149.1 autotransporter outer membrane beta-barrel domain-containing protein [Yersinia bercovieri]QKJ05596.1 autotransporter outer membrane beta-barrel domain-containing protein [Yersinia bercovieri ATCC 43970]